jgi:hypothetical protein
MAAEPFSGPIPPAAPIGRARIVDDEGRATAEFAAWLAKLMFFLAAPRLMRMEDTYDPPSLGPNAVAPIQTIPVVGARVGLDEVIPIFSQPLQGLTISAWVSAPDVVSFQFINPRPTIINLPSGTIRVRARAL